MPAGYTLTSGDLQIQIMKLTNYWKALLGATNTGLQRIADVGIPAVIAAYQAGGSPTYIKDLVDLNAATTAMSNVIYYVGYVGATSKTDNTGGAGLANPTAGPTVTPQGPSGPAAGTTAYYQVIAHTLNGTTTGFTGTPPNAVVGSTTSGWATLTTTNYNILTNYAVTGATSYDILKWSGSAWQTLGNTTAGYFMDTGQTPGAYSVPTSNTTGPLSTPGAPTVTPTGTAGTTTYQYQIVARNANGATLPSATGQTTTGNATLSVSNYNALSWAAVVGAAGYDVLKWNGSAWQSLSLNQAGTTYNDQGGTASAYTVPTSNTTAVQDIKVPAGSFCIVTSDANIVAVLKPVGTDQTIAIRNPSDLTAGSL